SPAARWVTGPISSGTAETCLRRSKSGGARRFLVIQPVLYRRGGRVPGLGHPAGDIAGAFAVSGVAGRSQLRCEAAQLERPEIARGPEQSVRLPTGLWKVVAIQKAVNLFDPLSGAEQKNVDKLSQSFAPRHDFRDHLEPSGIDRGRRGASGGNQRWARGSVGPYYGLVSRLIVGLTNCE